MFFTNRKVLSNFYMLISDKDEPNLIKLCIATFVLKAPGDSVTCNLGSDNLNDFLLRCITRSNIFFTDTLKENDFCVIIYSIMF